MTKTMLKRFLVRNHYYPHIHSACMPFKTYELKELFAAARIAPGDRILDLGCGSGTQTLMVGARCRQVVGVDVSAPAIERARAAAVRFAPLVDAQFHCGPIEAAGFAAESFDKVLSFCVLEHIPNYREVLRELYRLLKPGGRLVISADSLETISDRELIERHRREHHVAQYFRAPQLRADLSAAGFAVAELRPLFRSGYARVLFEQGIRDGFRFSFLRAYRCYLKLRLHEALTPGERPGIFLLASATKPTR